MTPPDQLGSRPMTDAALDAAPATLRELAPSGTLFLPMRVDALRLDRPEQVIGAQHDLQRLPWFDGARDHNTDTPWLAAAITADAFSEHVEWLDAGIHLHWALPAGLTRGATTLAPERPILVDGLWMPPAPNRWIVLLRQPGGPIQRAWRVDSDHVHPGRDRPDGRAIAYPRRARGPDEPPWLWLGRQVPLDPGSLRPDPTVASASGLPEQDAALTALGSGDPLFVAHYPGCRSVFGLHDAEPAREDGEAVYDVFGWYGGGVCDPLGAFVAGLRADPARVRAVLAERARERDDAAPDLTDIGELDFARAVDRLLRSRYGWDVEDVLRGPMDRILLHGRVHVDAAPARHVSRPRGPAAPIGLGASPAEAMAALALEGATVAPLAEARLVQAIAGTDLTAHGLDLGAKLVTARHDEQFRAFPGHSVWVLRMPDRDGRTTGAANVAAPHALPDDLAEALIALDAAQRAHDDALDRITALRQALFDDWSHYVSALYPEDDAAPFAADIDMLRELIDRTRLAPLEAEIARTGRLAMAHDAAHADTPVDAADLSGAPPRVTPAIARDPQGAPSTTLIEGRDGIGGFDVRSGYFIDGLTPTDRDAPPGPGTLQHTVRFRPGERLLAVVGSVMDWSGRERFTQVRILTTHGRAFGPFGYAPATNRGFALLVPRGFRAAGIEVMQDAYLADLRLVSVPDLDLPPHSGTGAETLAGAVAREAATLRARLAAHAETGGDVPLTLARAPGPRFYAPHDPVVALRDADALASERFEPINSGDGKLHLGVHLGPSEMSWDGEAPANLPALATLIDGSKLAPTHATAEDWHPVQLEWQAELHPLAEGANHDDRSYAPDFLTAAHTLPDDAPDLLPRPDLRLHRGYHYLAGRAILNPGIGRRLAERLGVAAQAVKDALPPAVAAKIRDLGDPDRPTMILPLAGFHDQLLMHRPELQLGIEDPAALQGGRDLAARVRAALGQAHPDSPMPDAPFHPIRSGEVTLQALRIIDGFGRTRSWKPGTILTTRRQRPPSGGVDGGRLPPRLTAPSRLDLRWLSAAHGDVESAGHPAASPVAGWILVDDLDGALSVHDGAGRALGTVTDRGIWEAAPGEAAAPRHWRDVADPTLARMLRWLCAIPDPALVAAVVDALDAALIRIDPAEASSHRVRALLVSRPMALVRVRIDLVARGGVAADVSARALRARMAGAPPDSHDAEDVAVAVRLGEHGQVNDGLCGFWLEGRGDDRFHLPHGLTTELPHPRLRELTGDPLTAVPVQVSQGGEPVTVAMLIDPRGSVHATTGVLPVKAIRLPPEHWRPVLARLRVTFPTGPILTPADSLELPLPTEPGHGWSWISRGPGGWSEIPHHPVVARDDLRRAFGAQGDPLWRALLGSGQLRATEDPERAMLFQPPPDADPARFDALGLSPDAVAAALHGLAAGIENPPVDARHDVVVQARDGWLRLSPIPASTRGDAT